MTKRKANVPSRSGAAYSAARSASIAPILLACGFTDLSIASLTKLAVMLRDALATMKTPGSKTFKRSAKAIREIADALFERGRVETIKRADETFRKSETTLQEAQRLVHGDRNADYGHPADNDKRIAAMARALFGWDIKAQDVGLFMIITKLSREKNRHKRDNLVDLAGYAEVVDWIYRDHRQEPLKPAEVAAAYQARIETTRGTEPPKP